jgi:hypothetical protein
MKRPKGLATLCLGVWLLASGLSRFVHLSFIDIGAILALLAIAAGLLILFER